MTAGLSTDALQRGNPWLLDPSERAEELSSEWLATPRDIFEAVDALIPSRDWGKPQTLPADPAEFVAADATMAQLLAALMDPLHTEAAAREMRQRVTDWMQERAEEAAADEERRQDDDAQAEAARFDDAPY